MKLLRKLSKKCYFRQAIAYFLTYCMLFNTSVVLADVVPGMIEGENVMHGTADFGTVGNTTTITTGGPQTIIEYSRFNIDNGRTVDFAQPGVTAATLNRIIEANPSLINGALTSNGRIFIVNPAGVIFGEGAAVNVAQLVASGLDITDQDFIDGNYEFLVGDGIGQVINNGTITANEGVALIGKKVLNSGTIMTGEGGFVVMAAGDRVLLGQPGSKIVVEMSSVAMPEDDDGQVINTGEIASPAGTTVLAAGDIFSTALDLGSEAVKVDGGTGRVVQLGTISADGIDGDGGTISLTAGDEVALGDGSLTTANGGLNGDGGNVLVLADDMAVFSEGARIEAKGGSESGDGGFFELSGEHILLAGDVDVTAENGQGGKILLDPATWTVKDGGTPATPTADTVSEEWIQSQSTSDVDVELAADYSIVVEDIKDNWIKGGTGDIVFRTVYNNGKIQFMDAAKDKITTTTGDIYMLAGDGSYVDVTGIGIDVGSLEAGSNNQAADPGQIYLYTNNGGSIIAGDLSSLGGKDCIVSVMSDGSLSVGAVTARTNTADEPGPSSSEICLRAEGNITLGGDVKTRAHGQGVSDSVDSIVKIYSDGGSIDASESYIEAWSTTKNPADGIANATIDMRADGSITLPSNTAKSPRAHADGADIQNNASDIEPDSGDTAEIIIQEEYDGECPDCPEGPHPTPTPEPTPTPTPEPTPTPTPEPTPTPTPEPTPTPTPEPTPTPTPEPTPTPTPEPTPTPTPEPTPTPTPEPTPTPTPEPTPTPTPEPTPTPTPEPTPTPTPEPTPTPTPEPTPTPTPEPTPTPTPEPTPTPTPEPTPTPTPEPTPTPTPEPTPTPTPEPTPTPTPEPTPTPTPEPTPTPTPTISPAPLPALELPEIEGCPVLLEAVALELGTLGEDIQVSIERALVLNPNIQPCEACARIADYAAILRDADGLYMDAMVQVFNVVAPADVPYDDVMGTSIVTAFAGRINDIDMPQYATAMEYINAFVGYVVVLDTELGSPVGDSTVFVMEKHGTAVTESDNPNIAAYIAVQLGALGG